MDGERENEGGGDGEMIGKASTPGMQVTTTRQLPCGHTAEVTACYLSEEVETALFGEMMAAKVSCSECGADLWLCVRRVETASVNAPSTRCAAL